MQTKGDNHYIAFISYKREDEEIAKKLHHTLEFYKLPIVIVEKEPNLKEGVRPVFVDVAELGDEPFLSPAIKKALEESRFLIVICSPRSAKSKWVNKEVQYFVKLKRTNRIIPFIIEGIPNAKVKEDECCTPTMQKLMGKRELLGINTNEMGFDAAAVKVVSRMFRLKFRSLWNRYEIEKEKERRKLKEQNDRLLIAQSRFVAEKARALVEDGDSYNARRVLLEVMPDDLDNPNRPMVTEAESSLRGACMGNAAVFRGHDMHHAVFSPDGKRIISASLDGHVDVWNMEDGSLLMTIKHAPCVMCVDYSPNANLIVTSSSEGEVVLWETGTGNIVSTLYSSDDKQCISYVAFSPNGKVVAATLGNNILLLEIKSRRLLKVFKGHKDSVVSVSFSPDGRLMVSASCDNSVIIWDLKKEDSLHVLKSHSSVVNYASFSHDGKRIASASMDQTIGIWDVSSGELIKIVDQINGWVNSVVFNPNNADQVVFASPQAGVCVVDIANDMSSDAGKIGAGFATYSPDGRFVAAVNVNDTLQIFNTRGSIPLLEIPIKRVIAVAYSPEDKHIVSYSANDVIQIWDTATGRRLQAHKGRIKDIKQMVFSPDGGKMVFISPEKDSIIIWDVLHNRKFLVFGTLLGKIHAAYYSPDGKYVVSVSDIGTIAIWDAQTGNFVKGLQHPSDIYNAFFSPDGKLIAIEGDDCIMLLDFTTGDVGVTLEGRFGEFASASFSPDGKMLVTVSNLDNTIAIWDVKTGEQKRIIKDVDGVYGFCDAVFSPDGKTIVVSNLVSIQVWNIEEGILLQTIYDTSCSVGFSKEGTRIASVTQEETAIRVWDFPSLQDLIDQTHERFKDRPLTKEERRQYYLE